MTARHDDEERAWATGVARAFLTDQGAGGRRQATAEGLPPPGAVLVAVVPLAAPEARDDEQEQEGAGGHLE